LSEILQRGGMSELNSHRVALIGYGLIGVVLAVMFTRYPLLSNYRRARRVKR
jgi:hypothetical protein